MSRIYEGYFNDSDNQMSSDDIVSDVESANGSKYGKYKYSIKVEIRCNPRIFDDETLFAKIMKTFINKCSYVLDNFPFVNEVGKVYIEQNDENGVFDPGPNDHELVFGGFSIPCNKETFEKGKDEAPRKLYRLWCTIPLDADIKSAKNVYRLFKYFYTASPVDRKYAHFFNCMYIINNHNKEFGIVSLDYDGYNQEYDFHRFYTIAEELHGLCTSEALFGSSYSYGDMLRDLKINDSELIFRNYFFQDDDYFDIDNYRDRIHLIGHFDKLMPCSNPNSWAYKKYPVCSYGLLFEEMGLHDATPAVTFSQINKYSWMADYCLKHGYSAYFLNCEEDGETVDKIVLIFDNMVKHTTKEYSIVLVGDEYSGYSCTGPIDILSCVMPYETAQDVVNEYGHLKNENEDEDEDDY